MDAENKPNEGANQKGVDSAQRQSPNREIANDASNNAQASKADEESSTTAGPDTGQAD